MLNLAATMTLGALTATVTMALPTVVTSPNQQVMVPDANTNSAEVIITFPEYSQYVNGTDRSDREVGEVARTFTFDQEWIENRRVESFFWYLYTPRDDAFDHRATPRWNLTCHATAFEPTKEPVSFELLYEPPYIAGPAESAVKVWCPEEDAACISEPCSIQLPTPNSDLL